MYQIEQDQLDESFKRRGLYAEKVIQDKASFLNGKSKVFNYLLQQAPSGDALPIFVIPPSEKLISLFSFTIQCKLPEGEDFQCNYCFSRNECLRKVLLQLQTQMSKMNKRHLTIDDIFEDYSKFRRTPRMEIIITCIVEMMIDLGEIK